MSAKRINGAHKLHDGVFIPDELELFLAIDKFRLAFEELETMEQAQKFLDQGFFFVIRNHRSKRRQ